MYQLNRGGQLPDILFHKKFHTIYFMNQKKLHILIKNLFFIEITFCVNFGTSLENSNQIENM